MINLSQLYELNMNATLKNLSEIVAHANDLLYVKFKNINTIMGIMDKNLRKQGVHADAITIDCLALDKKIVIFIHDAKPDTVDIALGNKAGDIHACTTHAIGDISEAFMLHLMEASFTASAD